ncbi:hypothetical protein GQR58_006370 [Nymphon striatum]|nr:hypothetical protein GQR58_006370 [Nymphon striatum]
MESLKGSSNGELEEPNCSTPINPKGNVQPIIFELQEIETRKLFYKKEFYLIWLIFCLDSVGYVTFTSIFKDMGLNFFPDDHFITTLDGLSAVFSVCGRLFTGLLCDFFSYKVLMITQCSINFILVLTLNKVANSNEYLFALWICIIYFLMGRTLIVTPIVTTQAFGPTHFVSNYGLLFSQFVVSSIISILMSLSILRGDQSEWFHMFLGIASCTALAGILSAFIPRDPTVLRQFVTEETVELEARD